MKGLGIAAGLAACSLVLATPLNAGTGTSGAEKLRRLDIMLMVTGLRCRTGSDDFRSEYGKFTRQHLATLNAAGDTLRRQYAARFGAQGAQRALDRVSTSMANAYGQGHPWLDCRELRKVTRELARIDSASELEDAADGLLSRSRSARFAYLGG